MATSAKDLGTEPLTPNQVAARLDRLPVGRFHWRFLGLISLGAWFDYFDNFVAGALAVILPRAGVLPQAGAGDWVSAVGLFMAALPLGMFLGCVFFGWAVDYWGRRLGFVAMLLLYSLATLIGGAGYYPLTAVAGAGAGLTLLLVTRLLAGAGVGAENVIIDAYISEMVPRQVRGRAIALTHAIAFTAAPAAFLLGRVLAPAGAPGGWWLLLVIGSLGALLTWYFRRRLPESPRWLALAGRPHEAAATLARIEQSVERETGRPLPPPGPAAPEETVVRAPFRQIWSPAYRRRTVMLVVFHLLQTVGYYGFWHWLAPLLIAKGFGQDQALLLSAAAAFLAPVGPLLGVWSAERWERQRLIVTLALALGAGVLALGAVRDTFPVVALASAIVVGTNWFSAVFHAYQAELFPTEARSTGVGFTYAWSRASMVAANVVMPALIARNVAQGVGVGLSWAFVVMALAFWGAAGVVGAFGPLTNARPLEQVSPG